MRYYRTILAGAGALLLMTCTSCSVEQLDADGDGRISRSEFWSAVLDSVCGGQSDSDDASTDDPSTDDPSTDDPSTDDPSTDDPSTDDPSTDDPSDDDDDDDDADTANGTLGAGTVR